MLAWAEPKQKRRTLINGILQLNANFIFCFRAKNTAKPVKSQKTGKNEVEQLGYMPIAGEEFVFEQTLNCLLLPGAGGVPTWDSENVGERTIIKLPEQFKALRSRQAPLDEAVGARLAKWASGASRSEPTTSQTSPAANQAEQEERAHNGGYTIAEEQAQSEPTPATDALSPALRKIEAAMSEREIDAIDKDTELDRSFMTPEQIDQLDEALSAKRTAVREAASA
jgi:hypothetical protein